jgi:hypothetical protein
LVKTARTFCVSTMMSRSALSPTITGAAGGGGGVGAD